MKINRSTKCSLKFATESKRNQLESLRVQYTDAVNFYINMFWLNPVSKVELLADVLHKYENNDMSARLKKVAAREAIDMIRSTIEAAKAAGTTPVIPVYAGNRMCLSENVVLVQQHKKASSFNMWLHFHSIGNKVQFDIPIKLHKHFHNLASLGKLCTSVTILKKGYVQFTFEIDTGPKQDGKEAIGIDTGINALASLSTGEQLGTDIKDCITRIKRCKHGSNGQRSAVRAMRQRMDETVKQIIPKAPIIIVEKLKNITKDTTKPSRRLGKDTRRSIGHWNVSYFLDRLKQGCELNRVSFRSVSPRNTSRLCPVCSSTDRGNRQGQLFHCTSCGFEANADINAARNILDRLSTGPYGAGCKPMKMESKFNMNRVP